MNAPIHTIRVEGNMGLVTQANGSATINLAALVAKITALEARVKALGG
jgi:hypothetical protein